MVLKRLLKAFRKEKPVEDSQVEEVAFSNLEADFKKKKEELSSSEKGVVENVKSNLLSYRSEAFEKVRALEEIDVSSSNVEDKVKSVIKENLENYIFLYRELFESLGKVNSSNLSGFLSKVDRLLKDFEKRSYKNYQKVAFLYENKIREANAVVIEVSNYLKKVSKENSSLIWKSEIFSSIDSKFKEIHGLREKVANLDKYLGSCDDEIENKEREKNDFEKKIEAVKESDAYKRNLEKEKQVKEKIREIDFDIEELKKSIDFKALGDAFHKDPNKIQLVKSYKNDFVSKFKEDWGESLKELLSSLGRRELLNKVESIGSKRQELLDLQNSFENSGLEKLESDLESIKLRISELQSEKEKEGKNREKFLSRVEDLENEIVNSLKQAGFRVID